MNNYLFFSTNALSFEHIGALIEQAKQILKDGNNYITWVYCSDKLGMCVANPRKDQAICKRCMMVNNIAIKKIKSNRVVCEKLSDLTNDTIVENLKIAQFDYNSLEDIKNIQYKNCNIGYAALSTYITFTRNLNPKLDESFKDYFNELLNIAAKYTELTIAAIEKYKPTKVYAFNARTIVTRPAYEIALHNGLDFGCVEVKRVGGVGKFNKIVFENAMPHSLELNRQLAETFWSQNQDAEKKMEVGRNFFDKRLSAKWAGDKIYVAHQNREELPENWTNKQENIVIFNSSEDEFCAIGKEWEVNNLFKTQLEGIRNIVEQFVEDNTKHFYLKIHPNLIGIKYKYHTELYNLKYRNLTVVPAESTVSTYAMMYNADKIVVFGSSTGAESVYAKKPVIQLRNAMYNFTDTIYRPKTIQEVYDLINTKNLPAKYSDKILIYGYYYNSLNVGSRTNIDLNYHAVFGKKVIGAKYLKILGSSVLFALFIIGYGKFINFVKPNVKFKTIPTNEA